MRWDRSVSYSVSSYCSGVEAVPGRCERMVVYERSYRSVLYIVAGVGEGDAVAACSSLYWYAGCDEERVDEACASAVAEYHGACYADVSLVGAEAEVYGEG